MNFRIYKSGPISVIAISSLFTIAYNTAEVRNAIKELVDGGQKQLVLDFTESPKIDSDGLGTLVRAWNYVKTAGGRMVLVTSPDIKTALLITRLASLLIMYDTLDKALKSFAEQSTASA
jgi:anti-sigma B factor antagonist